MENTKKTKKIDKNRIIITALASIIAPFIVFVANPMIIFGNNVTEFLFNWYDFVPICLGFSILASVVIFFSIIFLPEMAYKICLHVLIACGFLVFMQSTYLNGNLALSGDNLGEDASQSSKIINLVFWCVVFIVALVLAILKDKKKYIRTGVFILSVVVALTQLVSTVVPIISNKNYFKTHADRVGQSANTPINYSSYKNLDVYSSTGNIYYFLVDMFDEAYAETAYNIDPNIYSELTGFTWYKDNLTLYGHTYPGVAYALTGVEHSSEWNNAEYMKRAYESHNYLSELKNAGYTINLYTDIGNAYGWKGLPSYVNNALPATVNKKSVTNKMSLFKKLLKLGLYVSFPLAAKTLVGSLTSDDFILASKYTMAGDIDGYVTNNEKVKSHIDDIIFKETENKQFQFIHMAGTHNVDTEDQTKPTSATGLTKTSFGMINKFLQNLKDKGLYDEATIVITGDHPFIYGCPAPVALFFKPAQSESESQEELKVSTAKVEQKNIMPSIFDSIGVVSEIANAKGDKPLHLTDSSERKFIYHTLDVGFKEGVFKVTGSLQPGGQSSNWKQLSTKYYPNRRVHT